MQVYYLKNHCFLRSHPENCLLHSSVAGRETQILKEELDKLEFVNEVKDSVQLADSKSIFMSSKRSFVGNSTEYIMASSNNAARSFSRFHRTQTQSLENKLKKERDNLIFKREQFHPSI